MKFILVFFVIVYVFIFFWPKFTVSINGIRSDSLLLRLLGAAVISFLLTLFIGLPLLGIISIFT